MTNVSLSLSLVANIDFESGVLYCTVPPYLSRVYSRREEQNCTESKNYQPLSSPRTGTGTGVMS
jgi:hypothetical protein